jgi:hypothetical protein
MASTPGNSEDANHANELHESNRGRVPALAQRAMILFWGAPDSIGVLFQKKSRLVAQGVIPHTERFAINSRKFASQLLFRLKAIEASKPRKQILARDVTINNPQAANNSR